MTSPKITRSDEPRDVLEPTAHRATKGNLRLLLVDDNHEFVEQATQWLSGYQWIDIVGCASTGQEALDEVTRLQPDLVLMDVAMPGMSGPALQQELSRRGSTIPIIFITAHGDESMRPQMLQAGAIECLLKPFSETALLDAVTFALRGR